MTYDDAVVYPTVKGSAASGGRVGIHIYKEVVLEFNCLGVEQSTNLTLQINIPLHLPIILYIDKECSRGKEHLII